MKTSPKKNRVTEIITPWGIKRSLYLDSTGDWKEEGISLDYIAGCHLICGEPAEENQGSTEWWIDDDTANMVLEADEQDKIMRDALEREEGTELERMIKQGFCTRCNSYCYGSCEC